MTAIAEITGTTVTYPDRYRLTIQDYDPSWPEDRPADVHGMPYGEHWWVDRAGRRVTGYETGAVCGGCSWRPDGVPTVPDSEAHGPAVKFVPDEDPGEAAIRSGLAAVRYENVFGHRTGPAARRRPDRA
jgi:hypothetical protein